MYQEKVNIEQGIRPTGELLTDRSFLMPKTTKSDKNEQPEIMKDQEEFYYGIFSERSRNITDTCTFAFRSFLKSGINGSH